MKKDFLEYLNNKNCFKLILGAGNKDCAKITEIVDVYSNAGCKFFDINASFEVYNALIKGIKDNNAYICISVGMDDDIHFSKCKIDKNTCKRCLKCKEVCLQGAIDNFEIDENKCIGCQKCIEKCQNGSIYRYFSQNEFDKKLFNLVDCVEFHISTKKKKKIYERWQYLAQNFDGVLSICISRKYFSDEKLIKVLTKMLEIRTENVIIQADGNPMSGGKDDYLSSIQALSLAELIKNNFKDILIFVSGGTNSKTKELANLLNIDIAGVSVGSYARKIIQNKDKNEQILCAKNLMESLK